MWVVGKLILIGAGKIIVTWTIVWNDLCLLNNASNATFSYFNLKVVSG